MKHEGNNPPNIVIFELCLWYISYFQNKLAYTDKIFNKTFNYNFVDSLNRLNY